MPSEAQLLLSDFRSVSAAFIMLALSEAVTPSAFSCMLIVASSFLESAALVQPHTFGAI